MVHAPRKRPTRADVARLAGVSEPVVSYVVNSGPRPVAETTRKRVQDAIRQLNYRPNVRARDLSLGRTSTYGVIGVDVTNTLHAAQIVALDKELRAHGWSLVLAHDNSSDDPELHTIHNLVDRGVDGIIMAVSNLPDKVWLETDLPVRVVLLDRPRPVFGYTTIASDYLEGGFTATEHLISHGCRRIVAVAGPMPEGHPNPRYIGHRQALASAALDEFPLIVTSWDRAGGDRAAQILIDTYGGNMPDGIFALSDMLAVGLIHGLRRRGIRIPEDVALVSFDGSQAAEFASPGITSVTQPIEEMAAATVRALAQPRPEGFDNQVYPTELTIRQSCGC